MPDTNPDNIEVHRAIARAVAAHGIDTMFGLLGDANLFIGNDFTRHCGGTFVPSTHESGAVMMALGYGLVSGKTGVATITHGPALSNAATALIEGSKGNVPMVLLCGDTPAADRDGAQNIPQRAMVSATGAGFEQLRCPSTAATDVATAFKRARIERRPIVLNMPRDFMWQSAPYSELVYPSHIPCNDIAMGRDLENAIGILAAAKRPLVLAGRGAVGARTELVELAARLDAPLATTLKAKSLFQGEDYNLGVFGTLSTPAAVEAILAADCILSFGAGMNMFTASKGAFFDNKRIIQIDAYTAEVGRRVQPDAGLVGDPLPVAKTLLHWLDEAEIPPSRFTDELDAKALRAPHPVAQKPEAEGFVGQPKALITLNNAIPDNRIFASDGGRFMGEAWCRIDVQKPQDFVYTVNTGAIGMGMGHAIGAACAKRDRPTVLVTGDGGFMMGGLAEFSTALRENLDLIVIICNDQAYGAEYVQFTDRQMDPAISEFNWPSFAKVAIAMGGQGVSVGSDDDLEVAVAAIKSRKGPLLIDLRLDPATVPRMEF
ncbi:MAG: thiamine pyrophosphate-binding protein [Alphaproteobacteria bacterium]|nr:thiamine pyrophosphate-binding protein [Alphaproteobacteria bacterium]